MRTQSFHADGQTDRHDEANSHFSQFCANARKIPWLVLYVFREIMAACY